MDVSQADAVYSFNPWMRDMPIQVGQPAYFDEQDRLRYQALLADMALPAEAIRQIRPTVGNQPFPPRFGYEKRQPTIDDIVNLEFPTVARDMPTRQDSGMQGSLRPALGHW